MNDERFLKDWLQDTTDSSTDPNAMADKAVARVPGTPQRRRWLPWLPTRRSKSGDPSINGRTRSMFSPMQAVTAGALTLVVSGALLVASSLSDKPAPGPPGASTEAPAMTPFSGSLGCGTAVPADHTVWEFRDPDFTDPRLDGRHLSHLAGFEEGDPDVDGVGAYSGLWEVVTDDGAWVGEYATFRTPPMGYSTITVQLRGEGSNEGLTAIMEGDFADRCGWDIRGVVVEGSLPENPAPLFGG